MRFVVLTVAMLTLMSCASAQVGTTRLDDINVLYSLSIGQDDVLELSVYNPTDQLACTSYLSWPGGGAALRVVGQDGREWQYVGLEVSVVGRPQDLKIGPRSEVKTSVDLRKEYKPASSDTRIAKVYYGALFHRC